MENTGYWTFSQCHQLDTIYIHDLPAWCNINFDFSPLEYAHHLFLNGKEIRELVIPDNVTEIKSKVFMNCNIVSVSIPLSVNKIGNYAFSGTNLSIVDLPDNIESIGNYAFYGCRVLSRFNTGDGLKSIGSDSFRRCSNLTNITIGRSVEKILSGAFENCRSLMNIYCYADQVPYTSNDTFDDVPTNQCKLHVPNNSISMYRATSPWSDFYNIIPLTDEETEVNNINVNIDRPTSYFSSDGRRVSIPKKGFYIVKEDCNVMKKVIIR